MNDRPDHELSAEHPPTAADHEFVALLDAYDRRLADEPHPRVADQLVEPTTAWGESFVAHRERVLRPSLEQVAWKLQQWDHQPWVEDDASPLLPGQDVPDSSPATITLRFLTADGSRGADAAGLRFEPVPEHQKVQVSTRRLGREAAFRREGTYTLGELTEQRIFDLAAALIRRSLFADDEPVVGPATQPSLSEPPPHDRVAPVTAPEPPPDTADFTRTRLPFLSVGKKQTDDWRREKGLLSSS